MATYTIDWSRGGGKVEDGRGCARFFFLTILESDIIIHGTPFLAVDQYAHDLDFDYSSIHLFPIDSPRDVQELSSLTYQDLSSDSEQFHGLVALAP